MKVSLIMGTVGDRASVERFLQSLAGQSHQDYELIVVDQSRAGLVEEAVSRSSSELTATKYVRTPLRGLSRARNVGLGLVDGDVVGFPDDDCWYPPNLLQQVVSSLGTHPGYDGMTGRALDPHTRRFLLPFSRSPGPVTKFNVWWRCMSITIFLRRHVIDSVGQFDEELGVGSGTLWGASEEMDYLLRAFESGFRIHYDPQLLVYHPSKVTRYDAEEIEREHLFSRGMGRVLRKHNYPLWMVGCFWLSPVLRAASALLSVDRGRTLYNLVAARGRLEGWLGSGTNAQDHREF